MRCHGEIPFLFMAAPVFDSWIRCLSSCGIVIGQVGEKRPDKFWNLKLAGNSVMMRQRGLFEEIDRLRELTALGDPLILLNKKINWESFRKILETIRPEDNPDNEKNAGRKPFDAVMMFKVLILQRYYGISDDQMEFQLKDRRSFERFVSGGDTLYYMPDAKTIWLYRERFKDAGIGEKIFKLFQKQLQGAGLIGKSGKIIDASFVEVPRQRNSRDENQQIKEGNTPEGWKDSKKSQKDIDARWTEKNNEKHFGYKNHIAADKKSGLILDYTTTSAEVHDSQPIEDIVGKPRKEREPVYGDSAYRSDEIEKKLKKRGFNVPRQLEIPKLVRPFFPYLPDNNSTT